jgi:hypothetical protein
MRSRRDERRDLWMKFLLFRCVRDSCIGREGRRRRISKRTRKRRRRRRRRSRVRKKVKIE